MNKIIAGLIAVSFLAGCSSSEKEDVFAPAYDGTEEAEAMGEFDKSVKGLSQRYKQAVGEINAANPIAIKIGSWSLTLDEIDRRGGPSHQRALVKVHEQRKQEIESAIMERVYEVEAQKVGMSSEDLLREVMTKGIESVDKADFKKGGEVDVTAWEKATQEAAMISHLSFVTDAIEGLDIDMRYRPSALVTAFNERGDKQNEISFGNQKSNVEVEIFMDFECPYCAEVEPSLMALYEKYQSKVKFVYRLFPLPNHPNGRLFANVAFCANEQGKFWEFHKTAFQNKDKIGHGMYYAKQLAMRVGADGAELEACLDSGASNAAIDANLSEGLNKGVTGTPSVLINGIPVSGNQEYSEYERVVEAMLGN